MNSLARGWLLLCLLSPAYFQVAFAQAGSSAAKYPEKAIRFIVPFPPGAANDILARSVGQKLSERWGQSVVIDNRGGAGGTLGTAIAARATPDGYTIVIVPATHAINMTLYAKPPYDAVKDFAPIILLATGPYMLVVNLSLPVRSIKDLIALAKARPGRLNFGSAGIGNATHLIGALFKSMAGIDLVHVPYKGGTPALTDVIAGQVQMYFGTISATNPQVQAGRVRALAVTSARRSTAVPEVPTLDEAGVPGFDAVGWWGVLAPAGTPAAIIAKVNREIAAMVADTEMRQWLQSQGFEPAGGSPAQFVQYIKDEIIKWGKVVKLSGAKPN
ncbi:MAG: tripartite tricarboxylate transporter substrate binding protein [Betaproteobacteria bacterium]|nr:tripartite tricarboxylate transporter substrate binding protein [Betaproteobacteria bacterium]MBI3938280.1 tripartite tricarboxylate transporter substrate binding protein [Betaproteobacteria bacterium]